MQNQYPAQDVMNQGLEIHASLKIQTDQEALQFLQKDEILQVPTKWPKGNQPNIRFQSHCLCKAQMMRKRFRGRY